MLGLPIQGLLALKIFLRVGFDCQLWGWPYFSFIFNFLLSHQTDDTLILQCNLQGMLESTGGQLRVGADQADDGACVSWGMLLTACCPPCTVLRLPRGPHCSWVAGGLAELQYCLSWWPSWPTLTLASGCLARWGHFWTPAPPSLNSMGALVGVVHAAGSGSQGSQGSALSTQGRAFPYTSAIGHGPLCFSPSFSVPNETPWIGTLYILAPSAFLQTVKPSLPCLSSSSRGMQTCLDVLTWSRWVSPHQGGQLTSSTQDWEDPWDVGLLVLRLGQFQGGCDSWSLCPQPPSLLTWQSCLAFESQTSREWCAEGAIPAFLFLFRFLFQHSSSPL